MKKARQPGLPTITVVAAASADLLLNVFTQGGTLKD
jgi:hypothetical protein